MIVACEKEEPITLQNITLKDKPLAEIKSNIEGTWQFERAVGGFTGQAINYYKNSFITFKSNDSVYWIDNGKERVKTRINWIRTRDQVNDSTYIINIYDIYSFPESWGVQGIEENNLILYDVGNDGFNHYLTKKK